MLLLAGIWPEGETRAWVDSAPYCVPKNWSCWCVLQVWASLSLYRQILDVIEANDYNNFTQRAYVSKWKKMLSLPGSYLVALQGPASPAQLKQANMV